MKWDFSGSVRVMKQLAGRTTIVVSLCLLVAFIGSRYWANSERMNSFFDVTVPLDLWIYMRGGERVVDGVPLYAEPIFDTLPFTYPPFAGLLFSWVTVLDDAVVTGIWHSLSIAGVIFVVWACLKRLNVAMTRDMVLIIPLIVVALMLGSEPLHATMFWGQINVVLMVLVCLDFLPSKYRLPGIGVGLAAGIKLTPAFFGILFLVQRRWWAALGSFVTFLITVVLGFIFVPDANDFWTDAMLNSDRVGVHDNPGAQSLKSILVRVFEVESGVVWLVIVLVTVALVAWAAWLAHQRDNIPMAMGIVGIGSCLVSPFSWYHHWVWIVPIAVAVFVAVNQTIACFSAHNRVRWQMAGLMSVGGLILVMVPYMARNVSTGWLFRWDSDLLASGWLWWLYVGSGFVFIIGYIARALADNVAPHHNPRVQDGLRPAPSRSMGAQPGPQPDQHAQPGPRTHLNTHSRPDPHTRSDVHAYKPTHAPRGGPQ